MALSETVSFWRAWLRAPRSVGAVAPSGSALARLMTRHIDHRHGPVIELGPGTGVFTRTLMDHGLPPHRLALVEADPLFAGALAQRYPQLRVLRMDAAQLGSLPPLFGPERASAVISGLPLLSMPPAHVAAIIRGVFERQLQPQGSFYQFTYGHRCPMPRQLLAQLDLEAIRIGSVFLNLPPATVYCMRQRRYGHVAA